MLDIKLIRENPKAVQEAAKNKGVEIDIESILKLDNEHKQSSIKVQHIREERNDLNDQIKKSPDKFDREKAQSLKESLEKEEVKLKDLEHHLNEKLLAIPNLAKSDVPVGKDDSGNEVLKDKTYKSPTSFNFTPKDHLTLGEALEIIDMDRAVKVSGARFAYLKGDGVLLELALVQFAMDILIKEGFIPVIPPVLIKHSITKGLGYWQHGGHEDYYVVYDPRCKKCEKEVKMSDQVCECGNKLDNEEHALYLIGTAEHSLVPMHMDETFDLKSLPRRYIGFSSAFRREAGSYGKDTKGILRVHQFDKIEMVSFVPEGEDDKELEYLLSVEERFFQSLDIPYQVVKMCTGDLGFPAAKKYDIEAWLPSQNKYREVTSVSTVTDFQSRRLKIRYRDGDKTKFTYILNGTGFAIGRTIIAILENYQQEDGSVIIPEVLRKYIGKDKIEPRSV